MHKKEYLMQYDCLIGDEYKLWYIASRFSSLMEICRTTGEVRELYSLKKEGRYRSLIKDGNRLLLVPAGIGNLWVYDITNGKTISYPIPNEIFHEGDNWSAKYIRLGKYIYFSWASPVIVKYDCSGDRWQLLTQWKGLIPKDCQCENWFLNESFFYDEFLYFQIGTSNMMLKMNPDNNMFEVVSMQLPEQVASIDNTVFSNRILWMECINDNGTISIYCCRDWSTWKCEKILDLKMDMIGNVGVRRFTIMEKIGNQLILLPGSYDKVCLINVEDRTAYISDQYPTVSCDKLTSDWFSMFNYYKGLKLSGQFFVVHPWTHQLIEISEEGGNIKRIPIIFSDETLNKVIKREFNYASIYYEGILSLHDFFAHICSLGKEKIKGETIIVAQMIYDTLNTGERR